MDGAVEALAERARAGELGRLGIMGGTFDPVHGGHLVCAEQAREALGLDAVLFIPTGRPAFKLDRPVTDGELRLAMLRAAVAGNDAFAVSALEVERPGVTYAADTLRALRAALPDEVELVFITGADAALTLPRWRESGALADLAAFGVAARPGYELDAAALADLSARGFDIRPFAATALDISSSDIRRRVSEERTIRYLVPEPVRVMIEEQYLYREELDHGRLA
ncbi:nicotinate-nucleotide adenylyltransferase [Adlercreutzia sp. R25]|uniref:Probable nicotinate-nucleotide adenylyltransferase n=1 Tax=Adlercreutzia shanghongiae TaxID=3111773 RepID=A0ABU6IZM8_9ACTN|nr:MULTISPECIES: nicotinate-nucleotide adenylyltransferase [unclassified Adlercreutzia]MEC4273843.1 nicotinate-nucleotide adenylyltransferase [Adlercreutzia sp. R25]MEC4295307.1 nicotinate-nucleotide adenylyltransferase [Adlercreutzia sp. R22]